jgi:hypothetical protein
VLGILTGDRLSQKMLSLQQGKIGISNMALTIGREEVECESFRVRGSYSSTIARLFALPVAVQSTEPMTLEVTIKGNKFKPVKKVRRVYWQKKYVGYFTIGNVSQEWDGDRYRTRLELKQCERSDVPQDEIPVYKWRHDLIALSQNLEQTDGAIIAAGRKINPIAESWKVGNTEIASASDNNISPAVLPVSLGGTGASDPVIALINLGAISSASKGLPFGVAPLDANILVPIANLPAYPTLASLGAVATATYTAGLALKLDASARNAANGVTPLDANILVPIANLPAYPTLASLGAVATATYTAGLALKLDASARNAANGVTPLDANILVPIANLPAYPTLASLGAVATATYTAELALKLDTSARNAANGVAPLDANILVPIANLPLNTFQTFTAGVSFKGGGSPGLATNTQAGIDAGGLPRYWLVNASAAVNNRVKSITVADNGNVQIRHHNDDLSNGNVLEHTASGNVLTNGTMRPGSGATAFTGAQFVAGSTYFRTDIAGDGGVGCLTYSDGAVWRRVGDGSLITAIDIKQTVLTGTTAATQGGSVNIAHGLTGSKILAWSSKITQSTNAGIEPNFNVSNLTGFEYTVYHDGTNMIVTNLSGNSSNILSKTVTIVLSHTS